MFGVMWAMTINSESTLPGFKMCCIADHYHIITYLWLVHVLTIIITYVLGTYTEWIVIVISVAG